MRPQAKFDSFDDLISAITSDVEFGQSALDAPELLALREDALFSDESQLAVDATK